jgi:hypothetical protein
LLNIKRITPNMAQDNMDALLEHWPSLRVRGVDTNPLAEPEAASQFDTDPLADLPPETVVTVADEAAPADEPRGTSSTPQARLVTTLSVNDAQRALSESQLRSRQATNAQRTARGNLTLALAQFQRVTGQTQTFEQLARQHLASETQLRADRKAGLIPQRGGQRRLGSAIDSYSFYTRASGRGAGGGRAFGRGAYPKSMRGAVVPKE